ncbi:hypothetical protein OIU74_015643 [Salix koriyanagi]|uniref:Uncharacterized protein n=1 Tax=Salix koriyanagi TaxID=2511006 RepID=A0A9Q0PMX5_9ROSI|nr:hypothetical protein OIU74_015643 [Salix koriyanagi]
MPDAPETGLGTEPADQPFEMDMNNIPSSLMRDVEFSLGTEKMTWELTQSVAERGSSSKRPRLDDGLGGMDIFIVDEPETRQRTEQAHQNISLLLLREEALLKALYISDRGL